MTIFRELLFPRRCPLCDVILWEDEKNGGFCRACQEKTVAVKDCVCEKCGKEVKQGEEFCTDCRRRKHFFEQNRSLYLYQGKMKGAMYRLKYANRRCYAKIFAEKMAQEYGGWIQKEGIEGIIPVPLYWRKKRQRGYNQAEVLARELGECLGIDVYPDLVVRVRDSKPQKKLNYQERKNNLKNAFKIRQSAVKLRKILVIDDIYTTGSTMDEVSRMLLASGVKEVYCLSVCIGKDR